MDTESMPSESEGMNMDLASPQAEAQRLAAIDSSSALGRLADQVVLATLRWEGAGANLKADDRAAVTHAADWLQELASLMADPLDLSKSLKSLSKLDLLSRFDQLGAEDISSLVDQPLTETDIDSSRQPLAPFLLDTRDLLHRFADGDAEDSEVESIRALFTKLAEGMLSSVNSMLTSRPGAAWTTTPRS